MSPEDNQIEPNTKLRSDFAILQSEVSKQQAQFKEAFEKARTEMLEGRVQRAEKHTDYMRNWLAVLTPIVTGVLLLFGILSVKNFSELNAAKNDVNSVNREVQAAKSEIVAAKDKLMLDAASVSRQANEVNNRIKTIDSNTDQIRRSAQAAKQIASNTQTRMQTVESDSEKFEMKLKNREEELDKRMQTLAAIGLQSHLDNLSIKSSLASLSGDKPTILRVDGLIGAYTLIGEHFGGEKARVQVAAGAGPLYAELSSFIDLEQDSIQGWSETKIAITLSPEIRNKIEQIQEQQRRNATEINTSLGLKGAWTLDAISFRVKLSDQSYSNWSATTWISTMGKRAATPESMIPK
jgi:DNA repair exonuclease SbcCD ATPase subunit